MTEHSKFGFENMLGSRGLDTLKCRFTTFIDGNPDHTHEVTFIRGDGSSSTDIVHTSGGGFTTLYANLYVSQISRGEHGSTRSCPSQVLPDHTLSPNAIEIRGEQISRENTATGVYEYIGVVSAVGAVALILMIVGRGIYIAKRTSRAVIEETSQDDNLEYYENPHNGNVYWRLKRKRFF